MTISLCTFLRAVSYGLLLPFYVCGTELRRSLQRQGLQPVVLVLALTVILQWEQTFATLGGQYVGIVCSIALYAITAYALLRRSIGLALQQALCFFLLTVGVPILSPGKGCFYAQTQRVEPILGGAAGVSATDNRAGNAAVAAAQFLPG